MSVLALSENATKVISKRYLLKHPESGATIEDASGMFHRVADYIAEAESVLVRERGGSDTEAFDKHKHYAEVFYELLTSLKFLPNTPCLVNAGKRQKDSGLSACFVLPIEDDLDKIYTTLKDAAIIMKSGGGVGYSFSSLRPRGDRVGTTGGVAGGPVSFMKLFHNSAQGVVQGGVRPGAQMGILHCEHPDIFEFISCKEQDGSLSSFNISVAITDAFMRAVENDGTHPLINPRTKEVVKTIKARELWEKIVDFAHRTGDPGLFFVDEANKYNPTPTIGSYEATNPCGEVVLLPGEPCNLGSIVLSKFIKHFNTEMFMVTNIEDAQKCIDWDALKEVTVLATRFLDNIITMNAYPVDLVREMATGNRKIGLGVMGWADLLTRLGISYGSELACDLAESVMGFIKDWSYQCSFDLAEERGCFPNWAGSELAKDTQVWGKRSFARNSTKLTIAPTGSISIIADCSSGIEPHFALAYTRKAIQGEHGLSETLYYFNDDLQRYLVNIFNAQELREIGRELSEVGTLQRLSPKWTDRIYKTNPALFDIFKTAYDCSAEEHVRTQAAFQRHVDSSISKTINLPKSATHKDIEEAYMLAHRLGCKGITVYRDGSRSGQVLSTGESAKAADAKLAPPVVAGPRQRPHSMRGTTRFIPTGCGDMVVTVNFDEHGVAEVITKGGKSGGCMSAQLEAIGRLTSLALRSGVPKEKVISQLSGIQCHLPVFYPQGPAGHNKITSCGDAIAVGLIEAIAEMEGVIVEEKKHTGHQGSCPSCGGPVKSDSGCISCVSPACGWSKCG